MATGDGGGDYGRYVSEVLGRADDDIDFSDYDNDGPDGIPDSGDDDGVVDYLFVIVRDVPHGFIVGGATGVAGLWPVVSDDVGERGSEYPTADSGASGAPIVVSNSYQHGAIVEQGTFSQTVGVMAHEFGHSFNLPDLYDLSFEGPADDSAGIGRWGLMGWGAHGWTGSDGPVGFSA